MKQLFTLLMLFTFSGTAALAQDDNSANAQTTNVARVTFLAPGFSYEARTAGMQTFFAHAYLVPSLWNDTDGTFSETAFSIDPAFNTQYRFYYNYANRTRKEKRTAMNSMNYVAPYFGAAYTERPFITDAFQEDGRRMVSTLGAIWGMQRNYARNFSLDLQLGLGYQFGRTTMFNDFGQIESKTQGELAAIIDISLGFWLNSKKNR